MKLIPRNEKCNVMVKNIRMDIFNALSEFAESGHDCVEIVGYPHKDATSCASALRASIKKYRMFTIAVGTRKGKVYLYRHKIEGEKT